MTEASSSAPLQALLDLADRLDADGVGGVPEAWASVKLGLLAIGLPVVAGTLGVTAARATRAIRERIERWPGELAALEVGAAGVAARPASGRLVITSDLHRAPPGGADVPAAQGTVAIYEAMLEHYAADRWVLVENGDVEDFWISGGSAYGVAYEWAKARAGRRWSSADVYREHLARTIANYPGIYGRIEEGFHRDGRYVRLFGNHDDVLEDPAVAAGLHDAHPDLEVHEHLVLRDGAAGAERTVAVVTHGHQVDSWNAADLAALGRFGTWFGSTVADAPFSESHPGMPPPEATRAMLSGRQPNVLTRVSPVLGANRDLYSLDEVWLADAFRAAYPSGDDPWLILGHTHLPVHAARLPGTDDRWDRYINGGCGVHHQMVTAIEWDGTVVGADPVVQLVAWFDAAAVPDTPDDALVTSHAGRRIARRVLAPSEDGSVLVPV